MNKYDIGLSKWSSWYSGDLTLGKTYNVLDYDSSEWVKCKFINYYEEDEDCLYHFQPLDKKLDEIVLSADYVEDGNVKEVDKKKSSGKSTNTDIFEVYIYEDEEDANSPHGKELEHKTFYSEEEADEYIANLDDHGAFNNTYYRMYANELNGSLMYEYKEGYVVSGSKKKASKDLDLFKSIDSFLANAEYLDEYEVTPLAPKMYRLIKKYVGITDSALELKKSLKNLLKTDPSKFENFKQEVDKLNSARKMSKKVTSADDKEPIDNETKGEDKTPPGDTTDIPAPGANTNSYFYRDAVNATRKATVQMQSAIDSYERDIPTSVYEKVREDLEALREQLEDIVKDTESFLNPEEYID